jgi:hypothetical protein
MGLHMWVGSGVFTLGYPSTTTKCNFSTVPNGSRYLVKDPLDATRDYTDFYNYIFVEGATDYLGRTLGGSWSVYTSFMPLYDSDKVYIGRLKPLPPVKDESIRTKSDMAWVVRSLAENHGRIGRFWQFETFFHRDLLAGDYISLDGYVDGAGIPRGICQIISVNGGSIRNDEMTLTIQEVL